MAERMSIVVVVILIGLVIGFIRLRSADGLRGSSSADPLLAAIEQLDQAERSGEAGYPVQMIIQAEDVLAKLSAVQAASPHARIGDAIAALERAVALGSSGKTREAQDLVRLAVVSLSQAAGVLAPSELPRTGMKRTSSFVHGRLTQTG
jgi:hypothetical protein